MGLLWPRNPDLAHSDPATKPDPNLNFEIQLHLLVACHGRRRPFSPGSPLLLAEEKSLVQEEDLATAHSLSSYCRTVLTQSCELSSFAYPDHSVLMNS